MNQSIELETVTDFLDTLLQPTQYSDYCPNGLQVQGQSRINRVVLGVTACQALIDQAIAQQAQMVLVHHGLFWRGDDYAVVGMKHARLAALLRHDINLFAYHLPLDCHPTLGNNAQIAKRMAMVDVTAKAVDGCPNLMWHGRLPVAIPHSQLLIQLEQCFARQPLAVGPHREKISQVAWCSGAAQKYLVQAHHLGADAFISGEISEQTTHLARELGITYIACGHHATECFGVQAVGEVLQQQLGVGVVWVDIPNPV